MEQRRVQETGKQETTQGPLIGDGVAPTETYDVSLLKRALEMARQDAEDDAANAERPGGSAA